jgi:hypothetical protein
MQTTHQVGLSSTAPSSITLDEHERRILRQNGDVGLGRIEGEMVGCHSGPETVQRLRVAVLVADHIGAGAEDDEPGERTITDPIVIRDLRSGIFESLHGGFADDAYDFCDPEDRPTQIEIERKLGIDRFAIAAHYGVELDESSAPEDRRRSRGAQSDIGFYVARTLEEKVGEVADDLDDRSWALVARVDAALCALRGRPADIKIPAGVQA